MQQQTLSLLMVGAMLLTGCKGPQGPRQLVVAIDVSCTAEDVLLRYVSGAYELESRLGPQDRLKVYAFAHESDLIYDGPQIAGRDSFNACIAEALLKGRKGLATSGTRTELALHALARDITDSQLPTLALLETDGGIEKLDSKVASEIKSALVSFRGSPHLIGFAVIGVDQQYRRLWSDWLRPLGSRGTVKGASDYREALIDLDRRSKG